MPLAPPGCCAVLANPPTIAGSAAFTACCVCGRVDAELLADLLDLLRPEMLLDQIESGSHVAHLSWRDARHSV